MSGSLTMQDLMRLWERAGRPSTAEDFMELWEKFATKAATQADAHSEQDACSLSLPVDFEELADMYVYTADVPGLERANLSVRVNAERELTISGERKRAQPGNSSSTEDTSADNDRRRRRFERRFGRFSRTLSLPKDADVKGIRAAVEQGVLTLTVCKLEQDPNVTDIPIY